MPIGWERWVSMFNIEFQIRAGRNADWGSARVFVITFFSLNFISLNFISLNLFVIEILLLIWSLILIWMPVDLVIKVIVWATTVNRQCKFQCDRDQFYQSVPSRSWSATTVTALINYFSFVVYFQRLDKLHECRFLLIQLRMAAIR